MNSFKVPLEHLIKSDSYSMIFTLSVKREPILVSFFVNPFIWFKLYLSLISFCIIKFFLIFIIRNFWRDARPSSSESEDSKPEYSDSCTQTQEFEEKYNNYTLTHITLAKIIIVLASIILCSLQLKLEAVERFNALNS